MFFLASKTLGVLVPPANLLIFAALLAACLLYFRVARLGRAILAAAILGFFACGFGPVGTILIRPLEDRFASPAADRLDPAGIIVLGGAIDPAIAATRDSIALTGDAGRVVEAAVLALRYPKALLVFSGGSPNILSDQLDEAGPAQRLFVSLGISPDRILLERRSRNTVENAIFTRDLVKPEPGQQWLLVTSAAHMPRAVGTFRRAGFAVVPFPAHYTTLGRPGDFWAIQTDASIGLLRTDAAIHEWIGLLAYRLTGRTDALLPGPTEN